MVPPSVTKCGLTRNRWRVYQYFWFIWLFFCCAENQSFSGWEPLRKSTLHKHHDMKKKLAFSEREYCTYKFKKMVFLLFFWIVLCTKTPILANITVNLRVEKRWKKNDINNLEVSMKLHFKDIFLLQEQPSISDGIFCAFK